MGLLLSSPSRRGGGGGGVTLWTGGGDGWSPIGVRGREKWRRRNEAKMCVGLISFFFVLFLLFLSMELSRSHERGERKIRFMASLAKIPFLYP